MRAWLRRWAAGPVVLAASVQVLGWGPAVSVYYWPTLRELRVGLGWRYVLVCVGPLELDVQWV